MKLARGLKLTVRGTGFAINVSHCLPRDCFGKLLQWHTTPRANACEMMQKWLLIALLSAARAESDHLHGVCEEGQCKELSLLPGVWNLNRHDCNDEHLNDIYVSCRSVCCKTLNHQQQSSL